MESKTLSLRAYLAECTARIQKCKVGYLAYAVLGLGLGSIGVWIPPVFGLSSHEGFHLVSLFTYGFAIAGGMLLDALLRRDRNIEFTIVAGLTVVIGLILLLNPFFDGGPYPYMTYIGMLLIVVVWMLANVEDYEQQVSSSPENAIGKGAGDEIIGKGIET